MRNHLRVAPLIVLVAVAATAQDVKITEGVVAHQVFQRNEADRADLKFAGTADGKANGRYIEGRIAYKDLAVSGFDWTALSKFKNGRWTGEFKGLPTGGPYRLEVRIKGDASISAVDDILVGDLWILAGQSNMQGVAKLENATPPTSLVHSFDMADHWDMAREPLHKLQIAADPVHWRRNASGKPERMSEEQFAQWLAGFKRGAGLGLPFAEEMLRRTGVPVGLVPCAHGGTDMDAWNPARKNAGGDSMYGSMFRRFQAVGGKVKGILWYQGESDATPQAAPGYLKKFEAFVAAVREDFNQPDLPFYYAQLGRCFTGSDIAEWNMVQEDQNKAEAAIPHCEMVAVIDLELDDPIHIDTDGQKRLGRRLANLAVHDLFPNIKEYAAIKRGPRVASVQWQNNQSQSRVIRVTFDGVNGHLQADGRIGGFTLHAPTGEILLNPYKAQIEAETNSVLLYFGTKVPGNATLDNAAVRYGFGKAPYCNLRDAADMAVPVFGPITVQ